MKKSVKFIITIPATVVCLALAGLITLFSIFAYQTRNMTHTETKQITDGIYSIYNKNSNAYLIKADSDYILIDAGDDADLFSKELARLNIDRGRIKAIFLTHTDNDHVAAVKLFPDAAVYISADEKQMIDGSRYRLLIFKNSLAAKHAALSDNQVVKINTAEIKCISTPGHTPGAMCYIYDNKYLFTGDLLMLKNNRVKPFNNFFNMDTKTSIQSIKKISSLAGIKYIFTAHYGYTDNYDKAFKEQNDQ